MGRMLFVAHGSSGYGGNANAHGRLGVLQGRKTRSQDATRSETRIATQRVLRSRDVQNTWNPKHQKVPLMITWLTAITFRTFQVLAGSLFSIMRSGRALEGGR